MCFCDRYNCEFQTFLTYAVAMFQNFFLRQKYAREFTTIKHFQPSLIFAGKEGAYHSVYFTLLPPLNGQGLCLSRINFILGWKGLSNTNTLAYFVGVLMRKKKKFIELFYD
jgi:hypothetical protein